MTGAPRALFFDVFGTCVDWRTCVAREVADLAARLGRDDVDPEAVADAWRGLYQPQMETVRSGARPWVNLDVLHREALDVVLADAGLDEVTHAERDELTRAWHRIFGMDRMLVQMSVGTMPHDQLLRSIELFGTEVAPIVRAEVARRAEAGEQAA